MAERVCYDRILPGEVNSFEAGRVILSDLMRAVFLLGKAWPTGSAIHCAFLGGTSAQHDEVIRGAERWTEHANLKLAWGNVQGSHIRVTFDRNDGAWSYLGKDCLGIPANVATMNLGWQDGGVIEHEWGHALGMVHEHQNPRGNPLLWNREAVIASLSGPPNYWTIPQIEHNVLGRYSLGQTNGSAFDPDSVMLYAFPASWTANGASTRANAEMSALDAEWMRRVYPGRVSASPELPVGPAPVAASIGRSGEEDHYVFQVLEAGQYIVETLGSTDVVLSVLASDSMIASDDDSGEDSNARLELNLAAGAYRVSVRHYGTGTGEYRVMIRRG